MTIIPVCPTDGQGVAAALQQARENLDCSEHELVLDFSSVRQVDGSALAALEALAVTAADSAVKVALRGVNVDVYKVLKLVKLAPRFSFLA